MGAQRHEAPDAKNAAGGHMKTVIVVIAFNEEANIERCLSALLHQVLEEPFEVLVVDDGSTDTTAEIVKTMAEVHGSLHLIEHGTNQGRGAARRHGQDWARSEFIGFVDADIVVPSNWLTDLFDAIADVDGVSGIALPDGDVAVVARMSGATLRARGGSAEITGNNVLFRRTALETVGFEEKSRLGEDFRLAKRMVRAGLRLRTTGAVIVEHREAKPYRRAFLWMWESGLDASSLLFEFGAIRLPDTAALGWAAVVVVSAWLAVVGAISGFDALAVGLLATSAIDVAMVWTRFLVRPRPARWFAAVILNWPLTAAYLFGRTAGLVKCLLDLGTVFVKKTFGRSEP